MATILKIIVGMLIGLVGASRMTAAELPPIPVHFTVFALRPMNDVAFRPLADAPLLPLKFYPTARSPDFSYVGDMPISFYDLKSGEVIASASIPAHITKALLIFVPLAPGNRDSRLQFQMHVLDDGGWRHGTGGVAFINLSGLTLAGKLGTHSVVLGAGLSPTFHLDAPAELRLETEHHERRFRSYSQRVELESTERALLILFPPYYAGSLEVQGRLLIDSVPPEAP